MKKSTWVAIGWAGLTAGAAAAQPQGAWLAFGSIGAAPLALGWLASRLPKAEGRISAADAEALAWSESGAVDAPRGPRGGLRSQSRTAAPPWAGGAQPFAPGPAR